MLHVTDLSNHQKGLKLATLQADAFIFKATEGCHFIDGDCDTFVKQAKALNKPYGVYHFLDSSDVIKQATFFLQHIKGYLGEAVLVLDYEAYGRQGATQAKRFLDHVYHQTQIKPLIYMNESDANGEDWSTVSGSDYGLWVTKYATQIPVLPKWPGYVMWQYTSTPLDKSYFYGDKAAWSAYAKPVQTATLTQYHQSGTRFKAMTSLPLKTDETWTRDSGIQFAQHTIFDVAHIINTGRTTHGLIRYNGQPLYITLHKDYVTKFAEK
ncbi:MAG: GH25 family lysozyme [Vagococcus sp.]